MMDSLAAIVTSLTGPAALGSIVAVLLFVFFWLIFIDEREIKRLRADPAAETWRNQRKARAEQLNEPMSLEAMQEITRALLSQERETLAEIKRKLK